jgi:drug/metabolite transporter (DMT)-like permease
MRPNLVIAILLIAAGIAVFVYQGFTYQTREKVVDLGSVHVMADRTKTVPIPPLLGAVAIVGGIVLLAFNGRKG